MIYNLLSFDSIGDSIVQALRTLMASIGALLYSLIDYLYTVFIYVGKAEILENDFIQTIYRKVGLILGLFMVFKLTFSLVQSLISPDKFTDKKNGYAAIIGRSVIAIVLLGITPSIFREAFKLQNIIINDNIIYKLVAGKTAQGNMDDMGRIIASDLYFSFFTDNKSPYLNNGTLDKIYESESEYQDRFVDDDFTNLETRVRDRDISFDDTVPYLAIKDSSEGYVIEYNWLLSLAMAIAVIVIFVTYCIQVGSRVVQLAYLQIIAPVPILSYISDPDGSFKKWLKQCTTTFLDLFLRLAIIYFAVTMIGEVINQFRRAEGVIFDSTGLPANTFTALLVKIFIILGLLIFAKRVPELLKDLFPNLGGGAASLGFGIKKTFSDLKDSPLTKIGWSAAKPVATLAKKSGAYAWKQTGAKGINAIKKAYNQRKEDNEAYKEKHKEDNEAQKTWNKYGDDFNVAPNEKEDVKAAAYRKTFRSDKDKNGEYANSYLTLEKASDALKNFKGDTNSAEYRKLLSDKEKAQKNHDDNRAKYKELARREDQLKRYTNRHPEVKKNASSPSTSSSPSTTPPSMPNSYQSSNYKGANQPINEQNSMFANMSDEEWKARRSQNKQEIREERRNLREANQNDPNEYFDKMDQQYADEYLKNDGVSDDFDRQYETKRGQMEDAYKKAGWSQDSDGKWTKNGNGS